MACKMHTCSSGKCHTIYHQDPMVGRDQYGYITPTFSGSPWRGEINMAAAPLPSQGTHGGEKRGMENGGKWLKTGKNG